LIFLSSSVTQIKQKQIQYHYLIYFCSFRTAVRVYFDTVAPRELQIVPKTPVLALAILPCLLLDGVGAAHMLASVF